MRWESEVSSVGLQGSRGPVSVCVCACVRATVRACVHVHVCACVPVCVPGLSRCVCPCECACEGLGFSESQGRKGLEPDFPPRHPCWTVTQSLLCPFRAGGSCSQAVVAFSIFTQSSSFGFARINGSASLS